MSISFGQLEFVHMPAMDKRWGMHQEGHLVYQLHPGFVMTAAGAVDQPCVGVGLHFI